ncbi:MAG: hypothetical protein ABL982_19185, partial [Vicinamibacterales bacterium]
VSTGGRPSLPMGLACRMLGKPLFLLEGLRLPESCTPRAVTALLHPQGQDGYTSRLYFEMQFATTRPAPNWAGQQHRLLERSWCVYSWNPGRNDLRLAQMVLNHLKVVR